jgi:hypothetical protein
MTDTNRVFDIEEDGAFLRVQFTRENGEVVVGNYKRVGWYAGPKAVRDDINERMRLPSSMTETTRRK